MTYEKSSQDKNTVTSTLVNPIPVPTHGPGGSFTILAKVHINASPTAAVNAVRNTTTWASWNTFCPACKISPEHEPRKPGWLEAGAVATITYVMSPGGSPGEQGIKMTVDDEDFTGTEGRKGFRIAWISTGRAHWQLHSERVMEFVDDGEAGCDYVCWETFGGALAVAAKLAVGSKLQDRFGDYARDLKGFVEGGSVVT